MKKSDKIVLSGIFKILEMHIEIVRGQTETFIKKQANANNFPLLMLYKWSDKSHTGPYVHLFNPTLINDIEMGGKTLSETNICRKCFKNFPTHLLCLP